MDNQDMIDRGPIAVDLHRRVQRWQAIAAGFVAIALAAALYPWGPSNLRKRQERAQELLTGLVAAPAESVAEMERRLEDELDAWRILPRPDQAHAVRFLSEEIAGRAKGLSTEEASRLRNVARECLLWPLDGPAGKQIREISAATLQSIAAKVGASSPINSGTDGQ